MKNLIVKAGLGVVLASVLGVMPAMAAVHHKHHRKHHHHHHIYRKHHR